MKLYQKVLTYTMALGSFFFFGCGNKNVEDVRQEIHKTSFFDSLGTVETIDSKKYYSRYLDLELGDIDGDGDLDIMVGAWNRESDKFEVSILENRVPQKDK